MSPVYSYKCAKCRAEREMLESITEDRLIKCECGYWMERIYSLPSVVFKGTGWAKKDRRGGKNEAQS
jgi:putative FmdB family regulatory protein